MNKLILIIVVYLLAYFIPFKSFGLQSPVMEGFYLLQEYARLHVLTCLVPAFFIAGAISVFVSQASVMKYFGPKANRFLAYGVASVSGTILAVCSCTVLPIFAGIYKRGAGIGPATAFLYSGPAINVLAVILTARVLGIEIGVARAIGAVIFAVVIGAAMAFIFRKEENDKHADGNMFAVEAGEQRLLWRTALYFLTMVLILIFAAWGRPEEGSGFWNAIHGVHWFITGGLLIILFFMLKQWFQKEELAAWVDSTWTFAKQIFPLLFIGVFAAGILLGRPGFDNGLIPNRFIAMLVGNNSLWANFFAAFSGAFMYFATLTEIPILQGLMGSGMGKGPALALLLAGPALSLPSMLVIKSVMGTKKTLVYISLVIVMATFTGIIYGLWF
ncbi:MAG: permease [Elusimicrobiota bacterium]